MKYTLIEEKGQCALILRGESMTQYAVVSGLDKKTGGWDWTCCYYDFGKFSELTRAEALFKALDYRSILAQANEVIYVGQEYSQDCMLERNRYLVDHSSILLAVYNGTWRSGTGATMRYARKQGREVIIIDPISRKISCQCSSCV